MSFGGIRITPADKWFSLYIRFSDNWSCRACGRYCMRRKLNNPGLPMLKIECAHIFSRSHKNIRHTSLNALSLCFKCHNMFSGDETEWRNFVISVIGHDDYNKLLVLKNAAIPHWQRKNDKEIADFYRQKVMAIAKKEGKLWIIGK